MTTQLPVTVMFAMFWVGAALGATLLLIGLWRAAAVPRGAVIVTALFLLVDFSPFSTAVPFPVHAIGLVGSLWMAVALLTAGRSSVAATRGDVLHAH